VYQLTSLLALEIHRLFPKLARIKVIDYNMWKGFEVYFSV